MKPLWGALDDPKIGLQTKRPLRWLCLCTCTHLHPPYTPGARSFAHQRLLWCIRGGNNAWCKFVCRHGGCLLTKRGSKGNRHRPKRTKISNMSSVQHADPYTPPYGTHSGHKSGNNDDSHRKPTELAHSVPTPRDMCKGISCTEVLMQFQLAECAACNEDGCRSAFFRCSKSTTTDAAHV